MSDFEIQRLYKVCFAHADMLSRLMAHDILLSPTCSAWRDVYTTTVRRTLSLPHSVRVRSSGESSAERRHCNLERPCEIATFFTLVGLKALENVAISFTPQFGAPLTALTCLRVACLSARAVYSFKGLLDGDSRLQAASENNGSRTATQNTISTTFLTLLQIVCTQQIRYFRQNF